MDSHRKIDQFHRTMTQESSELDFKRKGRKIADPVDRLRARVWYWAVKARDGWTDYKLDIEFARNPNEERPNGIHRCRAFEAIRRHGIVPSPGTHPRRSYDLVAQVNEHPNFAGTAEYFHSNFWRLLKMRAMDLPAAHAFVTECMQATQIHRPSGELDAILKVELYRLRRDASSIKAVDLYHACLKVVVSRLPLDLNLLALVGALFREAYLACALDIAVVLKAEFLALLEQFCDLPWLDRVGRELLDLGERRVLFWQLDKHFVGKGYYDDVPFAVVERPLFLLDQGMPELISREKELFSSLSQSILESQRTHSTKGY